MVCCGSVIGAATERQFGRKRADADLAQYRAKGPGTTVRLLLAGICKAGAVQGRLLDVGSGVGAVIFELVKLGMTSAIGVDLSSAYVVAASSEAARRSQSESVRFIRGDFVDVGKQLPTADVVTLDRVICCYPESERLLDDSLRHADRLFAFSYPRDVWYVLAWVAIQNVGRRITGNPFQTFVHSAAAMESVIRRAGFELLNRTHTRTWCADVYGRT